MVNLLDFIGKGVKLNTNQQIEVKKIWFGHLGNGIYQRLEPQHIIFNGEIDTFFYTGPFKMTIDLINTSECDYSLNDEVFKGSYQCRENKLIITGQKKGKKEQITICRISDRTCVSIEGEISMKFCIIPGEHR